MVENKSGCDSYRKTENVYAHGGYRVARAAQKPRGEVHDCENKIRRHHNGDECTRYADNALYIDVCAFRCAAVERDEQRSYIVSENQHKSAQYNGCDEGYQKRLPKSFFNALGFSRPLVLRGKGRKRCAEALNFHIHYFVDSVAQRMQWSARRRDR